MTTPILVFDIETIPDLQTGQRIHPQLASLSEEDALTALLAMRHAEAGTDFMPLPLHKIACVSFLWVAGEQVTLKSLSLETLTEAEILTKFFRAFENKPLPILVSWNGAGFDIPVLLYRALHHRLSVPKFFYDQKGGYSSRYSTLHIDLMDKLSLHNYGYKQKLDTIAALCGLSGKGDMDGAQVLPLVQAGDWQRLTTYCESDVLNTWFIYLRYQKLLGKLDDAQEAHLTTLSLAYLSTLVDGTGALRHQEFLGTFLNDEPRV